MRPIILFVLVVLAACGDERVMPAATDPTAGIDASCDPIAPDHCGFPFPNDFWRVDGHVAFGPSTLPLARGQRIDPKAWADADGWSAGQAPMTFMPNATATGLPPLGDMSRSIRPDSPTILLNADTGELVPHFSEIDMSTFHDYDRALLLRPAVRLRDKTRYVVAIRHVVDADGKTLAPSASFKALRDSISTTSAALEARRAHFEDIFGKLKAAGIARDDLQLAWDYTTASRDNQTRVMIAMRDDALAKVGPMGPTYTITNVENAPNPWLAKRLTGLMTVPLYLDKPDPGGRLVLGSDGLPKQNGTAQFEFLVLIPPSATPQNPAYLLQNGHGLLGGKGEGANGYLAQICGTYNYVAIAVDWIGMAHDDVDLVTDAVSTGDVSKFRAAVDRQHQGFINALLAMRMLSGRMAADPNLTVNGQPIIDTAHRFYRGDSQGGIFGATYMSISTDVTRGLLGEPGMPYNILLDRSVDFSGLKFLLKGAVPNGLDVQIALALVQMIWDRTEPDGYASYMSDNLLPNTPKHEVLMHVAIGDHQVTTLGAHVLARTIGAKNFAPVNRSIFGIPEANGPIAGGNVMVEFDFGLHEQPLNLPTMDGSDPHDEVRVLDAAMKQTDTWFRTGTVVQTCDGPCNPQ